MTRKQKRVLARILSALAVTVGLLFLPVEGMWRALLFLLPYFCVGYDVLIKAGKGILHGQVLDENFLMSVATVGAFLLGEYVEGVAVMLLYQVGELFQSYAVGKSRRSIGDLMELCPDTANLEGEGGTCETVAPETVPVGSVILVRPGERVPIDGIVIEGTSALDVSALTGESMPVEVAPETRVRSGCINGYGVLRVRTTHTFESSTASGILALMEEAGTRKSRTEGFITTFARVYTPVVCAGALALGLLPPLLRMLLALPPDWAVWLYRALSFLVISCPCALVVSVPLTFFSALGGASRRGILIKGSEYVERLATVREIAMDKTGTVTVGRPLVSACYPVGVREEQLLFYAAHAEMHSTHPIAQGIRDSLKTPLSAAFVTAAEERGGKGTVATVDGHRVAVGNAALLSEEGVKIPPAPCEGTVVHVALDGAYVGCLLLADRIKEGARDALDALSHIGIRRTVMLTGDARATAERVSRELGFDEVQSELLPQEKLGALEEMLAARRGRSAVAYVGDGINDAPSLSLADVGIAMGALGSDAATAAADVVLTDDDPRRVAQAIRISRACMRIVRENVVLSIGVKAICLCLGAVGIGGIWLAIFADVGVMVLAVLNAIRALFLK